MNNLHILRPFLCISKRHIEIHAYVKKIRQIREGGPFSPESVILRFDEFFFCISLELKYKAIYP